MVNAVKNKKIKGNTRKSIGQKRTKHAHVKPIADINGNLLPHWAKKGSFNEANQHVNNENWHIPKWEREKPIKFWDPSRKLLKSIRDYQAINCDSRNPINKVLKKLCVIRHRFWSVITGAEIDLSCQIEGGLMIPHPNGIVIHPAAKIGANCLLFQQVTLAGEVTLGHHVDIGAGAKILGPLTIQNAASVGANAVVTKNVDAGDTVVGIPAKTIHYKLKPH